MHNSVASKLRKQKTKVQRLKKARLRREYAGLPRTRLRREVVDRQIDGLPRRSLSELRNIWMNLIPFIQGRNDASISPHALRLRESLAAEWSARTKLAEMNPDSFRWPSTDAPGGSGKIDTRGWHKVGVLSFLGYHVGTTSDLSQGQRRAIVDSVFLFDIPPVVSMAYMREWGKPDTGTRLRKLAESLAAFARNASRRDSVQLSEAIAAWEADLKYLHDRHYVGRFDFPWPDSLIGRI